MDEENQPSPHLPCLKSEHPWILVVFTFELLEGRYEVRKDSGTEGPLLPEINTFKLEKVPVVFPSPEGSWGGLRPLKYPLI